MKNAYLRKIRVFFFKKLPTRQQENEISWALGEKREKELHWTVMLRSSVNHRISYITRWNNCKTEWRQIADWKDNTCCCRLLSLKYLPEKGSHAKSGSMINKGVREGGTESERESITTSERVTKMMAEWGVSGWERNWRGLRKELDSERAAGVTDCWKMWVSDERETE